MNKLLNADLHRMINNRCFQVCLTFMCLLGLLIPFMQLRNMHIYGTSAVLDSTFFAYPLFINILLAVFCSLFTGTEYSDGTIRNKLIIGHSRSAIYLSNLITCLLCGLVMCLGFIICYCLTGIPLLGFFTVDLRIILILIFCSILCAAAGSACYVMVAMLCQNKALSAILCVLGAFVLLLGATYVHSQLNQPETYETYQLTNNGNEPGVSETVPNPRYLTGAKRTAYEFVYDFMPPCQAIQLANMAVAHPWRLPLYSLMILITTTLAGIGLFKKKDIN